MKREVALLATALRQPALLEEPKDRKRGTKEPRRKVPLK